jgi:hypothetical protein
MLEFQNMTAYSTAKSILDVCKTLDTNTRRTSRFTTQLKPNEVFVFGSSIGGLHNGGASLFARAFGAKDGIGDGLQGQTYAIPIKDASMQTLTIDDIIPYIERFHKFVKRHPELTFLVTPIGCGFAGYSPNDIAPWFAESVLFPNVYLPQEFWYVIEHNTNTIVAEYEDNVLLSK